MAETYIEPGNIVGYTKVSLVANNFTMLGMAFEGCGVGQSVKVSDLVGDFIGDGEPGFADQLKIWIPGGYRNFYFIDGVGEEEYDQKWFCEDDGETANDSHVIAPGEACWFIRRASGVPLTISGQVGTNNVKIALVGNNFTMFGNPFPVEIKVKDLVGDFIGDGEPGFADQLKVWIPGGYRNFYFIDGVGEEEYDQKWFCEDDGETANDSHVIEPGEACWFIRRGAGTWLTIPAPVIP